MDYLLSLSRNPTTAGLVRSLGLPVTLPPVLRRGKLPRARRLLNDVNVAVGAIDITPTLSVLASQLAPFGARVVWTGAETALGAFTAASEAWAEPVVHEPLPPTIDTAPQTAGANAAVGEKAPKNRAHGLLFDATGVRTRAHLDVLFTFFKAWLPNLSANGRVVLLAHPADSAASVLGYHHAALTEGQATEVARLAALWQGLEGFVRSLGKELGRKGSTANLIWLEPNAEARVSGPVRFFLSQQSAFVTLQPLRVSNAVAAEPKVIRHEQPLLGKVAIVTGGSRGIGRATVEALKAEGATVAIVEHPSAAASASVAARELGASSLLLDIAEAGAAQTFANWVQEQFGGVDVMVHNAGITRDKTLLRMAPEAWGQVLDVNLFAAIDLTQALLGRGLLRDEGRVISLASVGGIAGNVGQTNYALSKAGIIGWTRQHSASLAKRGITINAVAPGFIETQMTAKMPTMIREAARRLSALNQGGLPEDVAQAITFLALPDSVGVTGNVLRVCGGALIGA